MEEINVIKDKQPKLYQAVLLDLVGLLTYIVPGVAEYADVAWAPLSAWIFYRMYGGRLGVFGAGVSFLEEILPFTDFVPTFTIGWGVKRILQKKSTLSAPNSEFQGAP